jgi:hypothetical protein
MAESERRTGRDLDRDPATGHPEDHLGGVAGGAVAGVPQAGGGRRSGDGRCNWHDRRWASRHRAVGAGVGVIAGSVLGGITGKAIAERINPAHEDDYWHERNTRARPYAPSGQFGWTITVLRIASATSATRSITAVASTRSSRSFRANGRACAWPIATELGARLARRRARPTNALPRQIERESRDDPDQHRKVNAQVGRPQFDRRAEFGAHVFDQLAALRRYLAHVRRRSYRRDTAAAASAPRTPAPWCRRTR